MPVTMARATIAQRTQLVLETTYGVLPASPAWQRLPTLAIKPKPNLEAVAYREQGRKFASVVVPNREWSSATFDGALTFSELPFIYASLFSPPSPNPPAAGASGERSWTMKPSNDTPDTPATYTMQHGDTSANGIQVGGLVVTDATMEITRQACKLSGTMIGLPWTTAQTLAVNGSPVGATVTDVENIPVQPGYLSVYLDPTFGAIGTTKLTRFLSLHFAVTGRWHPEWVLDNALGSYLQLVEGTPSATITVKMEADAAAMALFAQYRAGTIAYLQMRTGANAPAIGSTYYALTLAVPVEVKNATEYSDEGGVYAIGFEFEPIADVTAGYPMQIITTSRQALI